MPDYIFITWQLLLLLNVVTFIIISRFGYPGFLWGRLLVELSEASVFLHGPLFFFYTLSLTNTGFTINSRKLVHFLPFVICILILLPGVFSDKQVSNTLRQTLTVIKMFSLLAYTTGVVLQLRNHRNRVETIFSNTEDKYLGWLHFLAWGIITVWLVAVTGLLLYNFAGFHIPLYGGLAGNFALCGLIFLIGYFGVRQEAIFNFAGKNNSQTDADKILPVISGTQPDGLVETMVNDEQIETEEETEPKPEDEKYKKSGLSKQKSLEFFAVLTKMMEEKKLYHESELTLFSLAGYLQVHPNHLSQIINQHRNQNFFDYVNELRVNDVKEALLSGKYDTHSLLGIGFEFGFNSKASFNRAFKKFTGMTPGEYKRDKK